MPVLAHSYAHFNSPGYITGLSAADSTGYWRDANGTPRLMVNDEVWGLVVNAGRFNGGAGWQADIDNYLAVRHGQGLNNLQVLAFSGEILDNAVYVNGNTWDNVAPFSGGYGTLNSSFWSRFDYLLSQAQPYGTSVIIDVCSNGDLYGSSGIWNGVSDADGQAFGAAIGNRWKDVPNLIWMFGNDYTGASDGFMSAMLAGIRGTGDTHEVCVEYYTEQDSRYNLADYGYPGNQSSSNTFGRASATVDYCYSYNCMYWAIEQAYGEPVTRPVMWGDGFYYGAVNNTGTPDAADQVVMRRMTWWALASGARGLCWASQYMWAWGTSQAETELTSEIWFNTTAGTIRAYFESLPDWYRLAPDTGSLLVTAGRGSRCAALTPQGSQHNWGDSDTYVAAARTPGGTLAVIYCAAHFSVTIDESKMAAGYTATWVDPDSCATSAATPGAAYNSTGKGDNSAGSPDWVLVLRA